MRVIEILDKIEGTIKTSSKDAEFEGIYAGDLLSHVMAHAKENNFSKVSSSAIVTNIISGCVSLEETIM